MMKTYARVDGGKVAEIIEPMVDGGGNDIAIEARFHPDFVAQLVDVTEVEGVAPGWMHADGVFSPPVPHVLTAEQKVAANTAAIQAELDRQARSRGYDNIVSACSYAAQALGAPFQAEGAAYLVWRSEVWMHAYAVLADVQAGNRDMPTQEEAVAEMPALVLP